MKKFFTLFMMSMFVAITSVFADESTWTLTTVDGMAEVTIVQQGTSGTGSDLELTKDGITVTSDKGYFAGSGSNGLQIYAGGTLTITAPANKVITSIVFSYPSSTYPFAEAVNEGGSATTKTAKGCDVAFTPESAAQAFTFTNVAGGQTKVKKMVITYEAEGNNNPATGWDGTITTSLDNAVLANTDAINGMSITFNGATSIECDEYGMLALVENEDGWPILKVWSAGFADLGCEAIVNGSTVTLNGWVDYSEVAAARAKNLKKTAVKKAVAEDSWYVSDYGCFIIDGEETYLDDIAVAHEEVAPAAEPFALTSVTNNEVAGNAISAVEASEQGVSYQFNVTATGKQLSAGTAVPTLTLSENGEDFGAATVIAYEAETAYIRFMAKQEPYFTTPGTYVLSIPEGTFVDAEGTPNAAVTVQWVVIEQESKEPFAITDVTNGSSNVAGSEVEALSYMFTVTTANPVVGVKSGSIVLTDAVGTMLGNGYPYGYEGEGGSNTVYVRFNFDTEDHLLHAAGTYTLNIPAGFFVDAEGAENSEFSASWTVAAPDTTIINIETAEVGTLVDNSWGTNDTYYTATVKFAKPEGAKYAYSEGLHMDLNGENTGVPFQFGQFGMIELEDSAEIVLVYKDQMIAKTDDAEYDGDIRPAGSYVATTEIAFMDENYNELPVLAKFTGSIVLPNIAETALGEPVFNVDEDPFYGKIDLGELEANGLKITFPEATGITPDMTIKVTAALSVMVPTYGAGGNEEGIDPGFGFPEFQVALDSVEFVGDAMFGAPEVYLTDFLQYIAEAGAGAYMIDVKSIEVLDNTGVVYTMDLNEYPVGTFFEVTEKFVTNEVVAAVGITEADQYGDQKFTVDVTVAADAIAGLGVANAYTEGVKFEEFLDEEPYVNEFTFSAQESDGIEVSEDNDIVFHCVDALVATTTDEMFIGAIRKEGSYAASCVVVLMDENYSEIGTAEFRGELELNVATATGIKNVNFNVKDVKINLAGQRVNNAKGIVIMNGKKVVLK